MTDILVLVLILALPFSVQFFVSKGDGSDIKEVSEEYYVESNESKSRSDSKELNVLLEHLYLNDYERTGDDGVDRWFERVGYTIADCNALWHEGRRSETSDCKKSVLIQQKVMEKAEFFDFSQEVRNMCKEVETHKTQDYFTKIEGFAKIKEKCESCEDTRISGKGFADFFEARHYMQRVDACEEYLQDLIEENERLKVLAKQYIERARAEAERIAKEKQKEQDRKKLQQDLFD